MAAVVVDHRIPHRGDQRLFWDRTNWQSLCGHCHDSGKQREEKRADRVDAMPWLLPPRQTDGVK